MSVIFMESFDHFSTTNNSFSKWTGTSATVQNTAPVRRVGSSYLFNIQTGTGNGIIRTLSSNYGTLCCGTGIRHPYSDTHTGIVFRDAGTAQITFRLTTTGAVEVFRGTTSGTRIGISNPAVTPDNQWVYMECNAVLSATGSYEVKIDGTQVLLSGAGLANTITTANSYANQLYLVGYAYYDDLYLTDGAFLGDCRVDCLFPTASGSYTQHTPSTGSNWQNVDDSSPDQGTTYNSSGVSGTIDTYYFTTLPPVSGTIYAVQWNACVARDAPGVIYTQPIYMPDSTPGNYYIDPSTYQAFDAYTTYSDLWESPPSNPGGPWLSGIISSGQFGFRTLL